MSPRVAGLVTAAVVAALAVPPATAASWPGPTTAEWKLTEVEGVPNAAAVILERTGEMFVDPDFRSSYLDVYTRLKVLTEEGTDYGSVSILSSDFYRTKNVEGRTHHPDGRVLELPADATFEKEYSDYYDTTMLSSALPEVVPGAIIEHRYRIYFDSVFFPRRWFFQADIPILLSSITFDMPKGLAFAPIQAVTLRTREMEQEIREYVRGVQVTYTMRDMPPVPDEPASFPFAVLSSRVFMLPTTDNTKGRRTPLFESWERVCELAWGSRRWGYRSALTDDREAVQKAKQLGSAQAAYEFVRDEIEVDRWGAVWCEECSVNKVLSDRKGNEVDKALVLYAMLDELGAEPRIGWTCSKNVDRLEPKIPSPSQMEDVLVVLDGADGRVFLDPSDRSLGYGALPPSLQGVPVLLTHPKKPEWVTTPLADAAASARDVTLELEVGEDGSVRGAGTMVLTGSHGWRRIQWRDTADETRQGWSDWLSEKLPDFAVADVTFEEDVPSSRVEVSWTMSQLEEDVLGDEVSLAPARPLALAANPFTLPPARRLTPVQLWSTETNRVHLELRWPEGWVLEAVPDAVSETNGAGSLSVGITVDEEARRATYDREMVVAETEFVGGMAYAELRELYQAAVDADATAMLLVLE